jgi:putative ATP-dependent endonuclease of the OLD family
MLMSFIAESSRRAVVFSIEEPESFLHPEAHRALGNGLDGIAVRPDVSVLVTTHSPFLLRDDGHGRSKVFEVGKNASGRSLIAEQRVQAVRATLLGSQVYADLLGRAEKVRDDARLILVVEGWTDMRYLAIAAERLGKSITHIDIVIAEGAMPAAMSVTSLRGLTDADRPVVVLFDDDEEGRRAHGALDKWSNKIVRLKYDKWVPAQNVAVEAEDLFSNSLLERFLNEVGRDDRLDGQNKRPGTSTWHYSLTDKGKTSLVEWLPTRATANECGAWGKLIEHLDSLIANAEQRAARRRAHPGGDVTGG